MNIFIVLYILAHKVILCLFNNDVLKSWKLKFKLRNLMNTVVYMLYYIMYSLFKVDLQK